jgi:hypothetical protein
MDSLYYNFLICLSLLLLVSYFVFGLLGLVAYFGTDRHVDRDVFGKVTALAFLLFVALIISLFTFLTLHGDKNSLFSLISVLLISLSPVAAVYLNFRFYSRI